MREIDVKIGERNAKIRAANKVILERETKADKEGNSPRYDNYLKLLSQMRERAVQDKVSERDERFIAKANAGDELRASRMLYYYLEDNFFYLMSRESNKIYHKYRSKRLRR